MDSPEGLQIPPPTRHRHVLEGQLLRLVRTQLSDTQRPTDCPRPAHHRDDVPYIWQNEGGGREQIHI